MIGADTCTAQWLSDELCSSHADTPDRGRVVVLDCRSADQYSAAHVVGSLLIVVPSIMLRRLRAGAGSVAAVVTGGAPARSLFTARARTSHVVLVDDCGAAAAAESAVGDGGGESVVEVLMNRLKQDGCRVSYLIGTYLYVLSFACS